MKFVRIRRAVWIASLVGCLSVLATGCATTSCPQQGYREPATPRLNGNTGVAYPQSAPVPPPPPPPPPYHHPLPPPVYSAPTPTTHAPATHAPAGRIRVRDDDGQRYPAPRDDRGQRYPAPSYGGGASSQSGRVKVSGNTGGSPHSSSPSSAPSSSGRVPVGTRPTPPAPNPPAPVPQPTQPPQPSPIPPAPAPAPSPAPRPPSQPPSPQPGPQPAPPSPSPQPSPYPGPEFGQPLRCSVATSSVRAGSPFDITGQGFSGSAEVEVGGARTRVTSQSANRLQAIAPTQGGRVTVRVRGQLASCGVIQVVR
jgi:hypothetical protein